MENKPRYNNPEIVKTLIELRDNDIHGFMDLVVESFKLDVDYVLEDPTPIEYKISGVSKLLKELENLERYEDCAFIKSVLDRLNGQQT